MVNERYCTHVQVTIVAMVTQVAVYRGLDVPVVSFDFPVILVMVRRGEDVVDVQDFVNVLKKLGVEASSVVGDELLRS